MRVLDCDNISLTGESLGLAGSGLFRAPEVMLGASPTEMSDAYALAVAAFRMLTGCHPLDGVRTHAQPFTPEFVKESFGKIPNIFLLRQLKMHLWMSFTDSVLRNFLRSSNCTLM